MVVSDHVPLFGPCPQAPYNYVPPATYGWLGTGASASSKLFNFSKGYAPCVGARLSFTWQPFGCTIALVTFTPGQATPDIIKELKDTDAVWTSKEIEFTSYMGILAGSRVDKYIGYQIKGDGITGMNLTEVRMELEFEIGGCR